MQNDISTPSGSASRPQDTPVESRDLGGPFLGIAKGITNGDFAKSLLELAGLRTPLGSNRGNQGPQPEIPWPTVMTEALNQMDQAATRLLGQLQSFLRRIDSNRTVG